MPAEGESGEPTIMLTLNLWSLSSLNGCHTQPRGQHKTKYYLDKVFLRNHIFCFLGNPSEIYFISCLKNMNYIINKLCILPCPGLSPSL